MNTIREIGDYYRVGGSWSKEGGFRKAKNPKGTLILLKATLKVQLVEILLGSNMPSSSALAKFKNQLLSLMKYPLRQAYYHALQESILRTPEKWGSEKALKAYMVESKVCYPGQRGALIKAWRNVRESSAA